MRKLLNKLPLKRIIIFESNPDFTDNSYWLFKYMAENTDLFKNYKCVWFVAKEKLKRNELCGIQIKCVDSISDKLGKRLIRLYYTWFAKVIIDCNRCIHKRRDKQYRVYLTHGMPIKIPDAYMKGVGKCDLLPVSGQGFIDYFSRYVERKSIRNIGTPRNDILISNKDVPVKEKYIVWMPTFRQHKTATKNKIENIFPLGLPILKTIEDIDELNRCLEENNVKMMLRPHPAQDTSILKIHQGENIIIATDEYLNLRGEQLYDFISKSSGLITDYSSIYLDYLFLDKPIGLSLEDAKEFAAQWPLFFADMENGVPGKNIINVDELCSFVKSIADECDAEKGKRREFMKTWGMSEIESCKTIVNLIIKEAHL